MPPSTKRENPGRSRGFFSLENKILSDYIMFYAKNTRPIYGNGADGGGYSGGLSSSVKTWVITSLFFVCIIFARIHGKK
jgi:hypothetical protein